MRAISFSEVTTALKCFAQWDFSYGDQLAGCSLKRRETATILSDGRAWGAGVATWHATGDKWQSAGALTASLHGDYEAMIGRGLSPSPEQLTDQYADLLPMLVHYEQTAARLDDFGQAEREIVVPLPRLIDGQGRSSRYRYQCFLDGFCSYSGHPAIAEFKLRESLTDVDVIERQPQYRWYAWAYAREIDWDGPVSVIVDERLKAWPHEARIVKARSKKEGIDGRVPSRSPDQFTTAELYVAACVEYGVTPSAEAAERLDARRWQQRVVLTFTPFELAEVGRELATAGHLVSELDRGKLYPVRNGSAMNCRRCRFSDVCSEPTNDFLVNSMFEKRPAKRDRADSERSESKPQETT